MTDRSEKSRVRVWTDKLVLPTYEVMPADRNPMFLEKRVYQGSSGRVYPLPYHDRISETAKDRAWEAIHLENEFLQVTILPEIGGRIHVLRDKTNGYDLIYNQDVIKPALVGLAGPWISGGIEFNWPQHHRPATYMPCDVAIEHGSDGSVTAWLGDHDPMHRMKGMHGVCLHPSRAVLEVKARLYNRTAFTQTFLWWANVATRVHEKYQSFFPPDVSFVADHAKRAVSRFPLCAGRYYGVDYADRAKHGVPEKQVPEQFVPPGNYPANDLSWYANIPVPTSYMCTATDADFFGGYDHAIGAGIVHVANHHISPGKKQWTWGNHEFGYAWDRNLTEPDQHGVCHPYIELMAGVYTDNQPDFSFLAPGETKTFSQFWYPIQKIGPATAANSDAAISVTFAESALRVGVAVTSAQGGATIRLTCKANLIFEWKRDLSPDNPFVEAVKLPGKFGLSELVISVADSSGLELIQYQAREVEQTEPPAPATEPPAPQEVESADELFTIGLHLQQYRHATREPQLYWREALKRDPQDSRCNNAMGLWRLQRGEFESAERHFRSAIARLTSRNPNPADGEPFYNLGLTLRYLNRPTEAYSAFYKSTWNAAWRSAGYHALAEIDASRHDWVTAIAHLDISLRHGSDNLRARNLRAVALKEIGQHTESKAALSETLSIDPLDYWAKWLSGQPLVCSTQIRLDLSLNFAAAGLFRQAIDILSTARHDPGTAPLVQYYLAFFYAKLGDVTKATESLHKAANASADYCFPARLEEIEILQSAIDRNPCDARAPYYLGNLYYDRRRYEDAIRMWEQSAKLGPTHAQVWRNLGIAYFNVRGAATKARAAYQNAVDSDPHDARLVYEQDQLHKRLGMKPRKRIANLLGSAALVASRDDLTVECCSLLNQVGRPDDSLRLIEARRFQPWEGGEGLALGQYVRSHLLLGQAALRRSDSSAARSHFESALHLSKNLGEARHLLANQSDVHYWAGVGAAAAGDEAATRIHWETAAAFTGDFQEMSVRPFSEMTYYSALALIGLGRQARARGLARLLLNYANSLVKSRAVIDYFATSLPTMLLFEDDLQARQNTTALLLGAQAKLILGNRRGAVRVLNSILRSDPNHALAGVILGELEVPLSALSRSPKVARKARIRDNISAGPIAAKSRNGHSSKKRRYSS